MTTATANRRMWKRRMRRAGWLVVGIISIPGALCRIFFRTWERSLWSFAIVGIVSGIGSCTHWVYKQDQPVTAEEILTATKGNVCVTELLPRRLEIDYKNKALTVANLDLAINDCAKANEAAIQIWRQQQALRKAKAAMDK